jgi:ABC-2 type transport system permease protein
MIALIRSELIKITSVRIPRWMPLAQILLFTMAASGVVVSGALSAKDLATQDGLRLLLAHGGVVAILSLCVGITMSAGEFRHGTVLDTYLSEPRRERVIAAKLAAAGLAGLAVGMIIAVATVAIGLAWCTAKNVTMDWSVAGRSAIGIVLWQALYTVIGVALGAMVRAQAAAVVAAVAWFFIAETALAQLVSSVGRWLPANAAAALGYSPSDWLLPQVGGGLVLAGWTLVAAAGAVVLTRRRDLA